MKFTLNSFFLAEKLILVAGHLELVRFLNWTATCKWCIFE